MSFENIMSLGFHPKSVYLHGWEIKVIHNENIVTIINNKDRDECNSILVGIALVRK